MYVYIPFSFEGGRGMPGGRKPFYGARNGSARGGYDRSNKIEEIQYEIDPQTREYYAHMAVQQM